MRTPVAKRQADGSVVACGQRVGDAIVLTADNNGDNAPCVCGGDAPGDCCVEVFGPPCPGSVGPAEFVIGRVRGTLIANTALTYAEWTWAVTDRSGNVYDNGEATASVTGPNGTDTAGLIRLTETVDISYSLFGPSRTSDQYTRERILASPFCVVAPPPAYDPPSGVPGSVYFSPTTTLGEICNYLANPRGHTVTVSHFGPGSVVASVSSASVPSSQGGFRLDATVLIDVTPVSGTSCTPAPPAITGGTDPRDALGPEAAFRCGGCGG